MPRLKDRLSFRVVTLTLILAAMTGIAVISGILSLQEFKEEYQSVKENHFDTLLKMTELKGQSNEVLRTSTEMFLSADKHELQWDILNISDKQLWIDKLFNQLSGTTENHKELLTLKKRLYTQITAISEAMLNKFDLSDRFFTKYERVERLKRIQIKKKNRDMAVAIDLAISHFNPIINKNLTANKETDLEALKQFIRSTKESVSVEEYKELVDLFIDKSSLASTYQQYFDQLEKIEELRKSNEELSILIVSVTGANVLIVQKEFLATVHQIEERISIRKSRLYVLLLACIFIAVILVILQIDFLRRVHLIGSVIEAGYSKAQYKIPIKGKDEISLMARAVKSYIDQLLKKELEVSESNKQLEHLATHDGLTHIYNRRYFDATFEQEHARFLRYKETYCIAMFDLDFFKRVNDTHGHGIGDQVLIDFTSRVTDQVRKTDVFARLGGEEFVLLMPRTVESNAMMLMERIRESVNAKPCVVDNLSVNFTTSIGLVEVQKIADVDDASTQLTFADKALYEAKQAGRNRICVYRSE